MALRLSRFRRHKVIFHRSNIIWWEQQHITIISCWYCRKKTNMENILVLSWELDLLRRLQHHLGQQLQQMHRRLGRRLSIIIRDSINRKVRFTYSKRKWNWKWTLIMIDLYYFSSSFSRNWWRVYSIRVSILEVHFSGIDWIRRDETRLRDMVELENKFIAGITEGEEAITNQEIRCARSLSQSDYRWKWS